MPSNRPRSPNADAEAAASIADAERLGTIPRAVDVPANVAEGPVLRERDCRVNPAAPRDARVPFKVTE